MSNALDRLDQRHTSATSQATVIEQSRAVAEVQAAIVVAQQCPRDEARARAAILEACQTKALAGRAFFSFPRAGATVAGPSIHLARELARCWGNIQYGITELRRDTVNGMSEMSAWAWDVQTNTRSVNTFQVPHMRDKRGSAPVPIVDLRDVYENNANMGARRLREAIFAVIPTWLTDQAQDQCNATITKGDGTPLAEQVGRAAAALDSLGVSLDRVEAKVGRKRGEWTAHDVARLHVSFTSLQQGTVTADEEFPRLVSATSVDEFKKPTDA